MLSRIAESLYWLGRHVERADCTARILDTYLHLLPTGSWATDHQVIRSLVDSMTNEVVVRDGNAIRDLIPGEPLGYDEAVRLALEERAKDPKTAKPESAAARSSRSGAE